jgi:hypothetical protein
LLLLLVLVLVLLLLLLLLSLLLLLQGLPLQMLSIEEGGGLPRLENLGNASRVASTCGTDALLWRKQHHYPR